MTGPAYVPFSWTHPEVVICGATLNRSGGVLSRMRAFSPDSWPKLRQRLVEMRMLQGNWDGEGATKPSHELIVSIGRLLDEEEAMGNVPPTRIAPANDGSILIEWQSPSTYATMEVTTPYTGELLIERKGYRPMFSVRTWSRSEPGSSTTMLSDRGVAVLL